MNQIDRILQKARLEQCSDVHIGMNQGITYRKNGVLFKEEENIDNTIIEQMIIEMMTSKQLEKCKQGKDVDFVYAMAKERYRVNVYHQQNNLVAAIRVINDFIASLDTLHLPPVLSSIASQPRGLVLVTGPTGSGKSTTLAAMIDYINSIRNCHILTIEDPIEYVYTQKQALIHQREIEQDVEDFDMALRSAMREDPDVILVGEMRDYETISAVLTLAETGHLVFSTLHTTGAAKTIDRIIDVFPAHKQNQVRSQLAGVLNAVITQHLLPLANNSGRIAALEIMIANDAISNLIRENKGHQIDSMIQTGNHLGMQSLNFALSKLVKEGKVTRESANQYTNDKTELLQYLG